VLSRRHRLRRRRLPWRGRSDPALALTGRHATSQILDDIGFRFGYPTLDGALSDLLPPEKGAHPAEGSATIGSPPLGWHSWNHYGAPQRREAYDGLADAFGGLAEHKRGMFRGMGRTFQIDACNHPT